MKDAAYTVKYWPTPESPAGTRAFSTNIAYKSLFKAQEDAAIYLATYPTRCQIAEIIRTEVVQMMSVDEARCFDYDADALTCCEECGADILWSEAKHAESDGGRRVSLCAACYIPSPDDSPND